MTLIQNPAVGGCHRGHRCGTGGLNALALNGADVTLDSRQRPTCSSAVSSGHRDLVRGHCPDHPAGSCAGRTALLGEVNDRPESADGHVEITDMTTVTPYDKVFIVRRRTQSYFGNDEFPPPFRPE